MKRILTILTGFTLMFVAAPRAADAQVYIGPEIAFNDEADFGVGAGLEFDLPAIDPGISYLGDFIFFFPDGFDYFEFNTNLTYDLPLDDASIVPFVLSGLNVARVSSEGLVDDVSNTEIGLNVGGGLKFNAGDLSPRVTGRFNLFSGETFTVTFFLPFRVSD